MPDIITLNLTIDGEFPDDSMADWIIHRASLLDLSCGIRVLNTTRIALTVSGERVLAEAFEVACSLGHFEAQVNSISRIETATAASFYRQRGQFIRYWPLNQGEQHDNT